MPSLRAILRNQQTFAFCITANPRHPGWTTQVTKVAMQEGKRIAVERHPPRLSALPTAHHHAAAIKIKIPQLHIARLLRTQAGIGKQRKQRSITEADRLLRFDLYRTKQRIYRIVGERTQTLLI